MESRPPAASQICPSCQTQNTATASFCIRCGTSLEGAETVAAPEAPAVPWRGWEAIVVWILATLTAGVLSFMVSLVVGGEVLTMMTLFAIQLSLGAWVIGWVRIRHDRGLDALGFRDLNRDSVRAGLVAGAIGLVLQFVLLPLTLLIARLLTGEEVSAPDQLSFEEPGVALLVVTGFVVVVMAPIAEELFFRGFLYQGLRRRFGPGLGAVFSAVVFAVAHIHPLLYVPIGTLGYILARTLERRGSVVPAMVGHALFNAVGYTFIVFGIA